MDIGSIVEGVKGRKILFVGKTKTMSPEDIELFLQQCGAEAATDENDPALGMAVRGRLLNPVEERMCDDLEKSGVAVVGIEGVEAYYAANIEREALLGSLMLFRNRSRIINLLHNSFLDDDLFCDILKLYDWEGRGPFESDENRDVAGAMVARFYPEIERNHNIQYSPVGPFLVAAHSGNEKLLEAISTIPDYEITQRSADRWMPATLHESLLLNPALGGEVLERFCDSKDERKRAFAAMHPALSAKRQRQFAKSGSKQVLEALARNGSLLDELYERVLGSEYGEVRLAFLAHQPPGRLLERLDELDEESQRAVGRNVRLDEDSAMKLVKSGLKPLLEEMASNETLTDAVYRELYDLDDLGIRRRLAANRSVCGEILQGMTRIRDKEIFVALASNPSMPENHLRNFSKIRDRDVMAALASNPSTPIEILLGYQTDAELSNILKRNEAFTEYIKRNIGW